MRVRYYTAKDALYSLATPNADAVVSYCSVVSIQPRCRCSSLRPGRGSIDQYTREHKKRVRAISFHEKHPPERCDEA